MARASDKVAQIAKNNEYGPCWNFVLVVKFCQIVDELADLKPVESRHPRKVSLL
jgi:hypothetical protein